MHNPTSPCMAINYRASGKLLAHCALPVEDNECVSQSRFIILSQLSPDSYAVSMYINGHEEWVNGTYCETFKRALRVFLGKCEEAHF